MTTATDTANTQQDDASGDTSFWDLYLQEHQQSANRWLHAIGTVASWIVAGTAIWSRMWWLLLFAPIAGYGCAWFGHAFVERNRPLSMKYPLKSFLADYRLTLLLLTGQQPDSESSTTQAESS